MSGEADLVTAGGATLLTILALLIIVIGTVALRLFGRAPVTVKLIVFIIMLGSASALGDFIIQMPDIQCGKERTPKETASIAAVWGNPSSLGAHHV